MKARKRSCTNPPPNRNGQSCAGQVGETAACSENPCPKRKYSHFDLRRHEMVCILVFNGFRIAKQFLKSNQKYIYAPPSAVVGQDYSYLFTAVFFQWYVNRYFYTIQSCLTVM